MPLSATQINKEIKNNPDKEKWISLEKGSGCYLVVKRQSARFIGKTSIGASTGKKYKVHLGSWKKDFNSPKEVLQKWEEMKSWGQENNSDLREFGKRITHKSEMTMKEVVDLFLEHKSKADQKSDSNHTCKNRLYRILGRLPEGILIDDLAGYEGSQFIKERVLDPDIVQKKIPTAKRYRQLLNNLFNFAVADRLVHPEQIPYRLDVPFPFESEHKSKPHAHLSWERFTSELIPKINQNPFHAERLTDLSTKAVLLMLTRVSAVVSMEWNWYDKQTNCWIIPAGTKGLKRKKGDDLNDHYIPNTLQLARLMDHLRAINGHQKYVFFSPNKGNHPYVSKQTPLAHLRNLGFTKEDQDVHGFRHVATNALVDIGGWDELMVSRCLGHLVKKGSIGHYDFAKRLDKRWEIHKCWNELLIKEGLTL